MTEISIMTVSPENTDSALPALLIEDQGLWRRSEPVWRGDDTLRIRRRFNDALQSAANVDSGVDEPIKALRFLALTLFNAIIPGDLAKLLADTRVAAGDDPPLLRIHLEPKYEWIPWEVLSNDGEEFLGLRFRIARLPIVARPPQRPGDRVHPVRSVHSVLGRYVATPDKSDFARWRSTFDKLLPDGVATDLTPPDETDKGWPAWNMLTNAVDILHVTCHGARDESGPFWTLDPRKPKGTFAYRLTTDDVGSLTYAYTDHAGPLVFGNACAVDAVAAPDGNTNGTDDNEEVQPPLATALYSSGALNFIGSLAPLRSQLAITFARLFYEELLGQHRTVSEALLNAKKRCRDDPATSSDPTYLFYCLYGPPETRYGEDGT